MIQMMAVRWFVILQPVFVHGFVPTIVHVHLDVIDATNSLNRNTTKTTTTMTIDVVHDTVDICHHL